MKQLDMKQVIEKWNQLLAEGCEIIRIDAELAEDPFWTKGVIMKGDVINKNNDCYVASNWATPQVIFELKDKTITLAVWEEGDNPSVVQDWIAAGCLGLDRKYEVGKIESWRRK